MEDELIMSAMNIILHAGDARNHCTTALEYAQQGQFEKAQEAMDKAHECIVEAHGTQTDLIQAEAAGKKHELNLLFIHAQDTLMTIMSEVNLTKQMVSMYEFIYKRVN